MRTLKQLDVRNKRVLLRAGFDVPIKDGKVSDDKRVVEGLPTIKYLLKQKAIILIICHVGRPHGKKLKSVSTLPIAERLSHLLKKKVTHLNDCVGVGPIVSHAGPGSIFMLENLRYHKGEEENDPVFAKQLASQAQVFVEDAFSNSHRDHASMTGVPKLLPSAAGLQVEHEMRMLQALKNPKKPFVVVLGGVKVKDKAAVIKELLKKADAILIGGAMALTFYKNMGKQIGITVGEDYPTKELLKSKKIMLPVDFKILHKGKTKTVGVEAIPKDARCLDNGPQTTTIFEEVIKRAKTILWSGPMGMFEDKRFSSGSKKIAKAIAKTKGLSVVGGGETLEVVDKYKIKGFSHVCTGGGAMLMVIEGKQLPALKPL
ncbi:phosphoglycerate kinase [Candidatus Woesearchaeota archaeon]|nr:phosphoglycerate kinase [Candidatus Woesearchaeota archaeon]|tara:strand:+ start:78 stop:1196 length:1119 start_codon:yes stop_codon:yes gene_type:complete